MKIWQRLEAKSTLFETSAFRATALIFGSAAFAYATVNLINSKAPEASFLSKIYFEYLFSILSQPVLVGGLSLPILGLVASHLRSIQTKDQIETQEQQNIFSNYAKHREFFIELCKDESLFTIESAMSGKPHEVYALLYPDAQEGHLGPTTKKIESFPDIYASTNSILTSCRKINWKTAKVTNDLLAAVETHTELFSKGFSLTEMMFQEKRDLSAMLTRLNRISVTHKHLATASTFIVSNDCSEELEKMHAVSNAAHEHLRQVTTEQNVLERLIEAAETRQRQTYPLNDYIRLNLERCLSTDTEEKLSYIEEKICNFSDFRTTLEEIKSFAVGRAINSE